MTKIAHFEVFFVHKTREELSMEKDLQEEIIRLVNRINDIDILDLIRRLILDIIG